MIVESVFGVLAGLVALPILGALIGMARDGRWKR